jgi:hypothetical protein
LKHHDSVTKVTLGGFRNLSRAVAMADRLTPQRPQRDFDAGVFRERQMGQHDGADAFLALEFKGAGFLASTSETSAF